VYLDKHTDTMMELFLDLELESIAASSALRTNNRGWFELFRIQDTGIYFVSFVWVKRYRQLNLDIHLSF
jgi:hypothetical protein